MMHGQENIKLDLNVHFLSSPYSEQIMGITVFVTVTVDFDVSVTVHHIYIYIYIYIYNIYK